MMVAAGFGVCFLPEFSPTIPGVRTQPVMRPRSRPRRVAGVDVGPAVLAGGAGLYAGDPRARLVARQRSWSARSLGGDGEVRRVRRRLRGLRAGGQ